MFEEPLKLPYSITRVRKRKNFPSGKILHAKTFRIECVNCDIFDFAINLRKTRPFNLFLANVSKHGQQSNNDQNHGLSRQFLSDPGVPGDRSMGPDVSPRGFVTLADEDSNSIPTDGVNGQSQAMWQCKWCHLVAKIETSASGNTWWPNL